MEWVIAGGVPDRMAAPRAPSHRRGIAVVAVFFFIFIWNTPVLNAADASVPEIYSYRSWQARDGLPQDAVQALAQTPDGYLWVGTSGGLFRFDGVRFVGFTRDNTPAFKDDSVSALHVSRDGSLWIGTEGGGLLRFRAGVFQEFASRQGLTNLFIRAIYEDTRSVVWVGTDAGIFRLEGDRFTRVDDRPGVPAMNVYTICEDSRGRILVGGLGLLIWDNGKVTMYSSRDRAADWMVNTVQTTRDGSLWIGTFAHLRRLPPGYAGDPFSAKFIVEIFGRETESAREPVGRYHISAITEAKDGNLWVGTWGQGLVLLRGGQLRRFRTPAFLPDDNVQAVVEDKEGNLWVGTQSGLVRVNRRLATTVTANGLPVNIRTVYSEPRGKLWMVSTAGHLFELQRDNIVRAALPRNLATVPLRTVYRDRAGALWLGTDGQGIFRIAKPVLTSYGETGAPDFAPLARAPYFIRAFCEDQSGEMWVAADSGLSRLRDEKFTWITDIPHSVRAVVVSRSGGLWVGTDTGAFRLRDGRVAPEPALEPLRNEKVWALYEDPQGGVWFGTRGAGLFVLNRSKLTRLGTAHGLPSNSIFSIIEDKLGALWMSSTNGVFSVQRSDLERVLAEGSYRPPVRLYGTSEGFSTRQMNGGVQPAGVLAEDGELWFASTGGAARIHPGTLDVEGPLPVVIEQVVANGREVPLTANLRLQPGTRDLEIHYTAIRLQSPERVRFRYRLQGFDDRWNEAGERRVAFYTNLPAGDYRFHLIAYDVNLPGKPAQANLALRVEPHFYQTPWFLGFCLLAACGVAVLGYMIHVRQIRQRFAAVLEERSRLAREMHDTLIQGCVGISTLLEAASSVQELSPSASRDLVERARAQVQVTIDDARQAVWKLREQSSTTGALAACLAQMAERVSRETGIAVNCAAAAPFAPVAPDVQHNLLLVAREAINNAVRHAAPTKITVDLSLSQGAVVLEISDNGHGFAEQSVEGPHYGIIGMRERVENLGGEFTIASGPGTGTVVRARVPCADAGDRKPSSSEFAQSTAANAK